mmetsp:Transcript_13331/g.49499  ORF Transcript_13331/g.49499 Transcript_13331/m.49499 type:complete len:232 (-) Transcript_13331:1061-1756(-)
MASRPVSTPSAATWGTCHTPTSGNGSSPEIIANLVVGLGLVPVPGMGVGSHAKCMTILCSSMCSKGQPFSFTRKISTIVFLNLYRRIFFSSFSSPFGPFALPDAGTLAFVVMTIVHAAIAARKVPASFQVSLQLLMLTRFLLRRFRRVLTSTNATTPARGRILMLCSSSGLVGSSFMLSRSIPQYAMMSSFGDHAKSTTPSARRLAGFPDTGSRAFRMEGSSKMLMTFSMV